MKISKGKVKRVCYIICLIAIVLDLLLLGVQRAVLALLIGLIIFIVFKVLMLHTDKTKEIAKQIGITYEN